MYLDVFPSRFPLPYDRWPRDQGYQKIARGFQRHRRGRDPSDFSRRKPGKEKKLLQIFTANTAAKLLGVCFFFWKRNRSPPNWQKVKSGKSVWDVWVFSLGGGGNSNIFVLFSPLFGEDFQFDLYFSDGLVQPPTSSFFKWQYFTDSIPWEPSPLSSPPFKGNMFVIFPTNPSSVWVFPKIMGTPKSSILFIVVSIIFTIHFGGTHPYFWKHPYLCSHLWLTIPPRKNTHGDAGIWYSENSPPQKKGPTSYLANG